MYLIFYFQESLTSIQLFFWTWYLMRIKENLHHNLYQRPLLNVENAEKQ